MEKVEIYFTNKYAAMPPVAQAALARCSLLLQN